MQTSRGYSRFAWFTLVFSVAVILWGAFVRASGSGAGCGEHWPLCNGTIIPKAEHVKTLIEYSHRISSGLSLIFVVTLFFLTLRNFPRGSFQRKAAGFSLVAILLEALLGAMLVLLRHVEMNESVGRMFSISFHLVNTLFLLGSLTVTAMATQEPNPRWRWPVTGKALARKNGILVGFAVLGALGALAALGDTLFPSSSLREEIQNKLAGRGHFLQQIRIFHPILAVLWAGMLWGWLAELWERQPELKSRATVLLWLTAGNLGLGLINVILLAPAWIQILHLLWGETLWILLVSLVFSAASRWR